MSISRHGSAPEVPGCGRVADDVPPGLGRSPIALAAAIAFLVIAVVTLRQVSIGRVEMATAEAAASRSEWPEAIVHARIAAEAFVPGSPWPDRARFRLQAIGHDAEARGDEETALTAYGALRTAAIATRTFIGSDANDRWRLTAEGGLARLAAQHGRNEARVSADTMLAELRDATPHGIWTFALLAAASLALFGALTQIAWLGASAPGADGAHAVVVLAFVAYAILLLAS